MSLKQLLTALSLGVAMTSCARPTLPLGYKPRLEKISYDNNNMLLKDDDLGSILPNVREVTIVAHYHFSGCSSKGERLMMGSGSSVRIKGDDKWDYYLSANHLFDLAKKKDFLTTEGEEPEICHAVLEDSFTYFTDTKKDLEVLVKDKSLDFAYVRSVKEEGIKFGEISLGDSSILKEGDFVYAIGYSGGMDRFVSSGNVSALRLPVSFDSWGEVKYDGRSFTYSAPTSLGNSGGGVFALYKGQPYLVGISILKAEGVDNIYGANKINKIKEKIMEGLRDKARK